MSSPSPARASPAPHRWFSTPMPRPRPISPTFPTASCWWSCHGERPPGLWKFSPVPPKFQQDRFPRGPRHSAFDPQRGAYPAMVNIQGANFVSNGTFVMFSGAACSNVTFIAASQLNVTVPVGAGDGPITVSTSAGVSTSQTNFMASDLPFIASRPRPPPLAQRWIFLALISSAGRWSNLARSRPLAPASFQPPKSWPRSRGRYQRSHYRVHHQRQRHNDQQSSYRRRTHHHRLLAILGSS